jgi:hypothetical protein
MPELGCKGRASAKHDKRKTVWEEWNSARCCLATRSWFDNLLAPILHGNIIRMSLIAIMIREYRLVSLEPSNEQSIKNGGWQVDDAQIQTG